MSVCPQTSSMKQDKHEARAAPCCSLTENLLFPQVEAQRSYRKEKLVTRPKHQAGPSHGSQQAVPVISTGPGSVLPSCLGLLRSNRSPPALCSKCREPTCPEHPGLSSSLQKPALRSMGSSPWSSGEQNLTIQLTAKTLLLLIKCKVPAALGSL